MLREMKTHTVVKIDKWRNNKMKEGEQVSAIPYTLLQNLEAQYGSIKNVPGCN